MARFTWTYGASEGSTIFINDNTLPNPKERGIAGIVTHQIGREEAERLAKLWIIAPSMLALLEKALPIIEEEADRRECIIGMPGLREYDSEMRELANEIQAEIDRAYGREGAYNAESEFDDSCPMKPTFDQLKTAIAKAEGKEAQDG